MQKNSTNRVIQTHQVSHKLHRLAIPYIVWLYILAIVPAVAMFIFMFIDMEGVNFTDAEFTFSNFAI